MRRLFLYFIIILFTFEEDVFANKYCKTLFKQAKPFVSTSIKLSQAGLTNKEIEQILLHELIVNENIFEIKDGKSAPTVVSFNNTTIRALKKQVPNNSAIAERAVYLAVEYLGLEIVPVTVNRKIKNQHFILQLFVENVKNLDDARLPEDFYNSILIKRWDFLVHIFGLIDNIPENALINVKKNDIVVIDNESGLRLVNGPTETITFEWGRPTNNEFNKSDYLQDSDFYINVIGKDPKVFTEILVNAGIEVEPALAAAERLKSFQNYVSSITKP